MLLFVRRCSLESPLIIVLTIVVLFISVPVCGYLIILIPYTLPIQVFLDIRVISG